MPESCAAVRSRDSLATAPSRPSFRPGNTVTEARRDTCAPGSPPHASPAPARTSPARAGASLRRTRLPPRRLPRACTGQAFRLQSTALRKFFVLDHDVVPPAVAKVVEVLGAASLLQQLGQRQVDMRSDSIDDGTSFSRATTCACIAMFATWIGTRRSLPPRWRGSPFPFHWANVW